jgi:hypothetical protein
MKFQQKHLQNPFLYFFKFRNIVGPELVVSIICGLFFLLFLYASANKLLHYGNFKVQLEQLPMHSTIAGQVAWLIPLIELAVSVMLCVRKTRRLALCASLGLMVVFTGYIIAILKFTDDIPRTCGGVLSTVSWSEYLIFTIVSAFIASMGIILKDKKENNKYLVP